MTKRVLLLVEGQTEERFVKAVLAPALAGLPVTLDPKILTTKRVKHGLQFKGGVTSFAKFERDVRRLLAGSGGGLVTTLIDYYGLPEEFPGMKTRSRYRGALERVLHVEAAIHAYFEHRQNFLPFLTLHEFEAWLFASPDELPAALGERQKQTDFAAIRSGFATPEDINERPGEAPSKRIAQLFPAYRKVLHGPNVIGRIGLERLRSECPHLAWWIEQLEAYAKP